MSTSQKKIKFNDKPTIGIGFFGVPRSCLYTFDSIVENILKPAEEIGNVVVRFHFYEQDEIINIRSNENSILDKKNYDFFESYSGIKENPDIINEKYDLKNFFSYGDSWNDDFKSLRNLILQLHSLHEVTKLLIDESPDLFILIRPDIFYYDSIKVDLLNALNDSSFVARVPYWQWAGGYNDRFSICGYDAVVEYGLRINKIDRYFRHYKKPLHSERFLKFCLDSSLIKVKIMRIRASRVRVNGAFAEETFSKPTLLRRIRWKLREQLKEVLLKI